VGDWLRRNGEAIYGTRPWRKADGRSADGAAVRFTQRGGYVYAIVLAQPLGTHVVLDDLQPTTATEIRLLGYGKPLQWQLRGTQVAIELPGDMPTGPAYTLRFSQAPV
jgi:alpha-L-fucosidase